MPLSACNFSLSSPGLRNWNSIIKKHMQMGNSKNAILTYLKMQTLGFYADNYTFPLLLKAAGKISDPNLGVSLHCHSIKTGFSSHVFVQTALINMYGVLHCVVDACKVFDRMPERDLVAWNSMLDVYTCNGLIDDAICLFDLMPMKDLSSFNIAITGFSSCGDVLSARRVFDEMGEKDVVSWNSMISGYTRVGEMDKASELFGEMSIQNVITWNTMITGCLQNDRFGETVVLFEEMKNNANCRPDYLTIVSVLSASARLGSLEIGKSIHIYANDHEFASNPYVVTALIDMYAKCGSIEQALLVFVKSEKTDIFCWNAMITWLALHGYGNAAIEMFRNMRSKNVRPDDITFIGLLNACSHSGLVQKGCKLFNSMEKEFGISPKLEHYSCIIDLLSRAGYLDHAFRVVEAMPFEPGESVLGALLSGCVIHMDLETGKRVIKLISCRGKGLSDGELMMFSNLYASCGNWEEANKWREMMNESGIVKTAGQSVIEVNGRFGKFMAGEMSKIGLMQL